MTWLFVLLVLVVTILAWRALRPRPPSPGAVEQQRAKDSARAAEDRVDEAADARRDTTVKAADEHLDEQLARDPVDRGNERIEAARRRRAGLLCVGLLLAPGRALARDCVYTDDAKTHVLCTAAGYRELIDDADRLDRDLKACAADKTAAEEKRTASHVRAEALEQLPQPEQPSPWTDRLLGAGGGLALALALVLLVR